MAKNLLQEFCQRAGHDFPIYDSSQTGPSHRPIWTSVITLFDGTKFHGEGRSTKIAAEVDVATKALAFFGESMIEPSPKSISSGSDFLRNDPSPKIKVKRKTVILVDVENLPKFISQLPLFEGPMTVFAFIGRHHHLASAEYGPEVNVIISPSTRPDGTDTCMQVHTGMFLVNRDYEFYLVATRDHFGASLVEMISSDAFCWSAKRAALVTTVNHIMEELALDSQR